MDFLLIFFGLILLLAGGEGLISGSIAIAKKLGLSNLLIGVVIVGLGTSTPELLISASAALSNHTDIALGNAIGSNIANILLILGIAAFIQPIQCSKPLILRDALAVVGASCLMLALTFYGTLPRLVGIAMILTLAGYIYYCYRMEHALGRANKHPEESKEKLKLWQALLMVTCSLAVLILGANLLIEGATSLARAAGISEAIIALSLVAVGTSIPELAAVISASLKKNSELVIGNILGSCLFNILGILGITAIIQPIAVSGQIAATDIPFGLFVASLCALIIFVFKSVGRATGAGFLALYAAYMGWLFLFGPIQG